MIVMTVFLSVLKQMEFHLVQNQEENYHHNHIPFNLNGIWKYIFVSEYRSESPAFTTGYRRCCRKQISESPRSVWITSVGTELYCLGHFLSASQRTC